MPENQNHDLYKIRTQDVVLGAALISLSFYCAPFSSGKTGAGAERAVVYHDGKILTELPLDKRATASFSLDSGKISVETEPGRGVHILESYCPAKVCVHAGWILRPGETIACLPNKLLVEIEGENAEYHAVI